MSESKIELSMAAKSDYELRSNGSSVSLSLNDSYESDVASGSSVRSSFGDCLEEPHTITHTKLSIIPQNMLPSTTNLPVISLVNEAWEYRGEGGANLVISITGKRKIIRFKKT